MEKNKFLPPRQKCRGVLTEDDIRKALARAYCTKENAGKVTDPTLMEAMVVEIGKVIRKDKPV